MILTTVGLKSGMVTIFKTPPWFLSDSLQFFVEGVEQTSYKNAEANFESSLLWRNGDWSTTG